MVKRRCNTSYDAENDILTIWTGGRVKTSAGIGDSLIVDFGSEDGFDVVGFELRGAAKHLAPFFKVSSGDAAPSAARS